MGHEVEEEEFEFVEGLLRIQRGVHRTYVEVVLKPGLQVKHAFDDGDRVRFSIDTKQTSKKEI